MSDLDKKLQEIHDFFKNPDKISEMKEHFEQIDLLLDHQERRLTKYISTIPVENLGAAFEKFLVWENKFEEGQYKRNHCITSSNIFGCIVDYARKNGTHSKNLREDFLSEKFTCLSYTFKLYCGQGCFWRIEKKNKQIFQST